MITRLEYLKAFYTVEAYHNQLKALDTVEAYQKQLNLSNVRQLCEQLSPNLDRNDFIKYIGGSISKYLTIGKKYRLIRKPNPEHIKVIIENDGGKKMITLNRYFKGS